MGWVARSIAAVPLLGATVLSLGVVPPFYGAIKNLEARWLPEPQQEPPG